MSETAELKIGAFGLLSRGDKSALFTPLQKFLN